MLKLKELNVQYITNDVGERSGVILSIEDFEALLEDEVSRCHGVRIPFVTGIIA